MERCHRCKSWWLVPELMPPAWRVLDGERLAEQAKTADESSIVGVEGTEDVEQVEYAEGSEGVKEIDAE